MIYLIISKDGRTFYSEDEPAKIVKEACIPLQAIYNDKQELVWSADDEQK